MPGLPFAKPTFPCSEELAWATRIIVSADGTEQRISLRKCPKQILTYEYPLSSDAEVARMDAMIHYWAKGLWYIPLWPQQSIHTASLSASGTTITMDTTDADYRGSDEIGNYAIVWQTASKYEIVTVSTVAAGSLTVSALVNSYSGSKVIAPCRTGYLTGRSSKRRWMPGSAMLSMTWEVIDNLPADEFTSVSSYDDMEVLIDPAYVPGGVYEQQIDADVIEIDSLTGRRVPAAVSDYAISDQTHQFAPWSQAAAWDHRLWLHSLCGRQKCFLVPTFRDDITLAAQCGAADTTITVVNRGFADYIDFDRLRCYVAFRPSGSNPVIRRVTDITELSATQEQFTLDAAAGSIYAAGSELSWADICRLATDRVELQWVKPGCCIHDARLVRVHNPAAVFDVAAFGGGVMP